MKLTPGKLAGLKKVSNENGVIAAAAMDQRGSLHKSLAKEKGGEVTDAMMEEFKSLVTEVLTPHASAILLGPSADYDFVAAAALGFDPALPAARMIRRIDALRHDAFERHAAGGL